ncbi:1 [Durusdinium trenchii]|uniref:N-acetylmuramoyl-L-alanine amidase n=1 Tax=Durusdinium trenchii TaxID=1381693 RepID=A0ABP0IXT0_9DINO
MQEVLNVLNVLEKRLEEGKKEFDSLKYLLNELGTMKSEEIQSLSDLLKELGTIRPEEIQSVSDLVRRQRTPRKFSGAVAMVGGDFSELRDDSRAWIEEDDSHDDDKDRNVLDPQHLHEEAQRVLGSIPGECSPKGFEAKSSVVTPNTVEEFIDGLDFENIEHGGTYFFYYAGHGFEVEGRFYFLPGKPTSLLGCVPLDYILERLKTFYGCTFIFCINSCRSSLQGKFTAALRDSFKQKSGTSFNNVIVMFPTASGVPAKDWGAKETTFEKLVKEFLPKFANTDDITTLFTNFATKVSKDDQDNPGLHFFPSAVAKPPTSGYTLLWYESHKDMQTTHKDGTIQVRDQRKAHRRRVNRMTAPMVLSRTEQKNVCVILDHTGGTSCKDYVARFIHTGMSANYMISSDGTRYLLVDEESMAWDYNLAYWGGADFIAAEDYLDTEGKINELKSYSISIALEGKDYTKKQYEELLTLLNEIRGRWNLDPWNLVGAEEVVQDPKAQVGPGPKFEWHRLAEEGFSLKVDSPHKSGVAFNDPQKPQKLLTDLGAWGYAFGPDQLERMFLEKRKAAFCHRYGINPDDAGPIRAAVESLLQQRSMRKTQQPVA